MITDFKNDFECIKREVTKKIEFHYTAETYDEQKTDEEKLEAIYRAHTSPK
jgi:6-pyruvoyl-tetrahydropterin synthase